MTIKQDLALCLAFVTAPWWVQLTGCDTYERRAAHVARFGTAVYGGYVYDERTKLCFVETSYSALVLVPCSPEVIALAAERAK